MNEIETKPGQVVRLDDRRTTSVRGGRYDVSDLPAERRAELTRLYGVRRAVRATAEEAQTTPQRARRRAHGAHTLEASEQ